MLSLEKVKNDRNQLATALALPEARQICTADEADEDKFDASKYDSNANTP